MRNTAKFGAILPSAAIIVLAIIVGACIAASEASQANGSTALALETSNSLGCLLDGLTICIVSALPKGANYSLGSWYPGGDRLVRMRMVNGPGSGWSSPGITAQQALQMIQQLRPNVLERMTSEGLDTSTLHAQVPVCSGCASMTYLQFLDNATSDCNCYILPRIDAGAIDNGTAPPGDNFALCTRNPINRTLPARLWKYIMLR